MPDYLEYRMSTLASAFTLYPPYLPIMYAINRTSQLLKETDDVVLQKHVDAYRKKHPRADDSEVFKHVIRSKLSNTIEGTPRFYARQLQELIAAVQDNKIGMPQFFLTLTADEVSELRWAAIADLEAMLPAGLKWEDAPVECTRIFKAKLDLFMAKFIFDEKNGLLGKVKHAFTRIEFQDRGTPHAHICIWLDGADAEEINSKADAVHRNISACIPTYDEEKDVPEVGILRSIITRKNMHTCYGFVNGKWGPKKCMSGRTCCKHRYPFCVNDDPLKYNQETNKYEYLRLSPGDAYVVSYLPSIALLWNAHHNIQRVTDAQWSVYMLKYTLKAEPAAKLNFNIDMLSRLGYEGVSDQARNFS